ncbi:efflux RND transporter periplasmic adaptor subunit [Schlegelella sp. S2-27]|uniref:Efflux RND transporter periplasmic adaptor subunit n=1 Tax=Caldimonas mangrovi TaxID=2944811 RepID=A0ABT0YRR7_9BURK|nr:efflux RND transporter periplasmic adaptor subunit [Caldimonas mangrovi]MCM5680972.1 efflux RND transporter periplasmic adaptor subunit [Caldimonas mangrovi]
MKQLHAAVAVVGIAVASLAAYWYQHKGAGSSPQAASTPAPSRAAAPAGRAGPAGTVAVEVGKVETTALTDEAQAVGTLRSRQGVVVRPEVAGRIAALGFRDGQQVRKGQLLVQLDDTLVAAQVKQAQAEVSIARANDQRNRELLAENFVSQAAVDQTAANLQVAEAQLALARAQLERMKIVAPFNGTAGIRLVNVGDYLAAGADIVNLEDLSRVYVDFRLPERYLPQLRIGQSVQVTLDALPQRRFQGRIEAMDPLVDASGRSVLVRASLDNPDGMLRPGMFARVDTVLSTRAKALVVPEEAVLPDAGKQYVIKVVPVQDAQGQPARVSQRSEVQTGARRQGRVEILKGVEAGDVVVTAGHQRVARDGTMLQVVDLGGASAASEVTPAASGPAASAPAGAPADARVAARQIGTR